MKTIPKPDLFGPLLSLFYPPVCAICSGEVPGKEYLCQACQAKAPRIQPPFCAKCSEPFFGAVNGPFFCSNCSNQKLYFEAAVAVYQSRGIVRRLVHEFKYGYRAYLRHVIAGWLCAALDDPRLRGRAFDCIAPVPLHPARQRERGFNQAELLGQLVAARTGVPLRRLLERTRYTTTQTAFDRAERMKNLRNAFHLRKKADVRGLRVLLIDDVLTTGSTLSACARVLRRAGASSVYAATAARA